MWLKTKLCRKKVSKIITKFLQGVVWTVFFGRGGAMDSLLNACKLCRILFGTQRHTCAYYMKIKFKFCLWGIHGLNLVIAKTILFLASQITLWFFLLNLHIWYILFRKVYAFTSVGIRLQLVITGCHQKSTSRREKNEYFSCKRHTQ